jgi:hypothetical protein
MSVVDWTEFTEPFHSIGRKFSEMLPALVRGDTVTPPRAAPLRRRAPASVAWMIERRMEMGLSRRELALRAACSHMQIGRYERGEQQPPPAVRARIAAILLPESQP